MNTTAPDLCCSCLYYRQTLSLNYHGDCTKHDKHADPVDPACDSLRNWHKPEDVTLYQQETQPMNPTEPRQHYIVGIYAKRDEPTTATATCPDCHRSQAYIYLDRLDMIRTAAVALETLPHDPDCPRYRRHPRAKGNASQLQATLF